MNDLRGKVLFLMLLGLPFVASVNIECRKHFMCVNTTYFNICVDFGDGKLRTIEGLIYPCPPGFVCAETNINECQLPLATTTIRPSSTLTRLSDKSGIVLNTLEAISVTTPLSTQTSDNWDEANKPIFPKHGFMKEDGKTIKDNMMPKDNVTSTYLIADNFFPMKTNKSNFENSTDFNKTSTIKNMMNDLTVNNEDLDIDVSEKIASNSLEFNSVHANYSVTPFMIPTISGRYIPEKDSNISQNLIDRESLLFNGSGVFIGKLNKTVNNKILPSHLDRNINISLNNYTTRSISNTPLTFVEESNLISQNTIDPYVNTTKNVSLSSIKELTNTELQLQQQPSIYSTTETDTSFLAYIPLIVRSNQTEKIPKTIVGDDSKNKTHISELVSNYENITENNLLFSETENEYNNTIFNMMTVPFTSHTKIMKSKENNFTETDYLYSDIQNYSSTDRAEVAQNTIVQRMIPIATDNNTYEMTTVLNPINSSTSAMNVLEVKNTTLINNSAKIINHNYATLFTEGNTNKENNSHVKLGGNFNSFIDKNNTADNLTETRFHYSSNYMNKNNNISTTHAPSVKDEKYSKFIKDTYVITNNTANIYTEIITLTPDAINYENAKKNNITNNDSVKTTKSLIVTKDSYAKESTPFTYLNRTNIKEFNRKDNNRNIMSHLKEYTTEMTTTNKSLISSTEYIEAAHNDSDYVNWKLINKFKIVEVKTSETVEATTEIIAILNSSTEKTIGNSSIENINIIEEKLAIINNNDTQIVMANMSNKYNEMKHEINGTLSALPANKYNCSKIISNQPKLNTTTEYNIDSSRLIKKTSIINTSQAMRMLNISVDYQINKNETKLIYDPATSSQITKDDNKNDTEHYKKKTTLDYKDNETMKEEQLTLSEAVKHIPSVTAQTELLTPITIYNVSKETTNKIDTDSISTTKTEIIKPFSSTESTATINVVVNLVTNNDHENTDFKKNENILPQNLTLNLDNITEIVTTNEDISSSIENIAVSKVFKYVNSSPISRSNIAKVKTNTFRAATTTVNSQIESKTSTSSFKKNGNIDVEKKNNFTDNSNYTTESDITTPKISNKEKSPENDYNGNVDMLYVTPFTTYNFNNGITNRTNNIFETSTENSIRKYLTVMPVTIINNTDHEVQNNRTLKMSSNQRRPDNGFNENLDVLHVTPYTKYNFSNGVTNRPNNIIGTSIDNVIISLDHITAINNTDHVVQHLKQQQLNFSDGNINENVITRPYTTTLSSHINDNLMHIENKADFHDNMMKNEQRSATKYITNIPVTVSPATALKQNEESVNKSHNYTMPSINIDTNAYTQTSNTNTPKPTYNASTIIINTTTVVSKNLSSISSNITQPEKSTPMTLLNDDELKISSIVDTLSAIKTFNIATSVVKTVTETPNDAITKETIILNNNTMLSERVTSVSDKQKKNDSSFNKKIKDLTNPYNNILETNKANTITSNAPAVENTTIKKIIQADKPLIKKENSITKSINDSTQAIYSVSGNFNTSMDVNNTKEVATEVFNLSLAEPATKKILKKIVVILPPKPTTAHKVTEEITGSLNNNLASTTEYVITGLNPSREQSVTTSKFEEIAEPVMDKIPFKSTNSSKIAISKQNGNNVNKSENILIPNEDTTNTVKTNTLIDILYNNSNPNNVVPVRINKLYSYNEPISTPPMMFNKTIPSTESPLKTHMLTQNLQLKILAQNMYSTTETIDNDKLYQNIPTEIENSGFNFDATYIRLHTTEDKTKTNSTRNILKIDRQQLYNSTEINHNSTLKILTTDISSVLYMKPTENINTNINNVYTSNLVKPATITRQKNLSGAKVSSSNVMLISSLDNIKETPISNKENSTQYKINTTIDRNDYANTTTKPMVFNQNKTETSNYYTNKNTTMLGSEIGPTKTLTIINNHQNHLNNFSTTKDLTSVTLKKIDNTTRINEKINNTTRIDQGNKLVELINNGTEVHDRMNTTDRIENLEPLKKIVVNMKSNVSVTGEIVPSSNCSNNKPQNLPTLSSKVVNTHLNTTILIDANVENFETDVSNTTKKLLNLKDGVESKDVIELSTISVYNMTGKYSTDKIIVGKRFSSNSHVDILVTSTIIVNYTKTESIGESMLQNIVTTNKTPIIQTNTAVNESSKKYPFNISNSSKFDCSQRSPGKYAYNDDCRTFYICVAKQYPVVKICPEDTVFSEISKQCTKNLAHCIRDSKFYCPSAGRFSDITENNHYYICVMNKENKFVKFKFQCQQGYHLNVSSVKCVWDDLTLTSNPGSNDSGIKSSNVANTTPGVSTSTQKELVEDIKCNKEGKIADPNDCRNYYECSEKDNRLSKKLKRCDSDEVFDSEQESKNIVTSRSHPETSTVTNNKTNNGERIKKVIPNKNCEQKNSVSFNCRHKNRGKYADNNDCNTYYVCIGKYDPLIRYCPENTVFSEIENKCTKNLSHCIRQNEFKCASDGKFIDILRHNYYYICVWRNDNHYLRYHLKCENGFDLDKSSIKCTRQEKSSSVSEEIIMNKNWEQQQASKGSNFVCEEKGKFFDPHNCKKYYVCWKKHGRFHKKKKKCKDDEVFHRDKKYCVSAESYECNFLEF